MAIPLIESLDGFEAVRNAIANILVTESALQEALATAAAKDPAEWALDVYVERVNPWELYRDDDDAAIQVVNVWYESSTTDKAASNNTTRQMADSTFNIDCMAYAVTEETAGGQTSGDQASFERAQKVARLVRQILMDPSYIRLGIPPIVSTRWVGTRRSFQPTSGGIPVAHVAGVQIQLDVKHSETIDLSTLESGLGADINIYREPDGKIMAEADIDWP